MENLPLSPRRAQDPGHVVILAIDRESSMRGEVAFAMSQMWPMVATAAALRENAHCLTMTFDGYDDDPRELYEVPEVRAYMRKLMDHCPWLAFLLSKWDAGIFRILPALMCDAVNAARNATRVEVEVDAVATRHLAMRCIRGAGAHFQQLGIPKIEADAMLNELITEIAQQW